jgi:hypothetical protein
MEMLKEPVVTEEPVIKISEPKSITNSREILPGSIKINGFSPLTSSTPLTQNITSSKLS